MNPRCEALGKYVLPVFRSLVARELTTTYKLTQVETAKRLGTTQAAISQYINSKRAFKGIEQINNLLPQIQRMAKATAKRLADNEMSAAEVSVNFCKLCSTFIAIEPEGKKEEAKPAKESGDNYAI